jgi:hypothetical protein
MFIDEADFGIIDKSAYGKHNKWLQIKEKLKEKANVLLLSATGKPDEKIGLQRPFTTWTYKDCLTDERPTAKLIRVKTFVPGNIELLYENGSTETITSLEDLSAKERRGLTKSPTWTLNLVKMSIESWLECRKQSKIPWQMHIIGPTAADIKDWLFNDVQALLEGYRCPVYGTKLTACFVISDQPDKKRKEVESQFKNLEYDVIISFGVLGRSADYPLLSCSCVLRMYDTTIKNNVPVGSKAHHQGPIGRVVRTLGEYKLKESVKKSSKYSKFLSQIMEAFKLIENKQECLILESATNFHRPHYEEFKKNQGLTSEDIQYLLMEEQDFIPSGTIEDVPWKTVTPPGSPSATDLSSLSLEEEDLSSDDADAEFSFESESEYASINKEEARETFEQQGPEAEKEDPSFLPQNEDTEVPEEIFEFEDPMDTGSKEPQEAEDEEEEETSQISSISTRSQLGNQGSEETEEIAPPHTPPGKKKKGVVIDASATLTYQITRFEAQGEVIEKEGVHTSVQHSTSDWITCAICNHKASYSFQTCLTNFSSLTEMNSYYICK